MKCVAVAVLLLALLGVAGCGGDEPQVPPWAKVAPEQIAEAKKHGVPVAFENDLGMRFVLIPAGTFVMGTPGRETWEDRDLPPHEVALTRPFYMQVTEVANAHFRRFRSGHSSGEDEGASLDNDAQPAVRVSWQDAQAFASWASDRDSSHNYRLPTEAEWEYACRAGTTTRFWWGESDKNTHLHENVCVPTPADVEAARRAPLWARYEGEGMPPIPPVEDGYRVTAPVGSYLPNEWGLHDMLGNVREWCLDWFTTVGAWVPEKGERLTDPVELRPTTHRVLRGGSWHLWGPWPVDRRGHAGPQTATGVIGFRLVSPLPEPNGVHGAEK